MNAQATSLAPMGPPRIGDILVQMGVITAEIRDSALEQSKRTGAKLGEILLQMGEVARGDLIEALHRQGAPIQITKLQLLPEWDALLSDKGAVLGGDQRDPGIALIADTRDARKRCFLVVAENTPREKLVGPMARAAGKGYIVAGRVEVPAALMKVLYSEWDAKGGRNAASIGEESQLQTEFRTLAYRAFQMKASDIHIASFAGVAEVKFRVHGELEHIEDMTPDHAHKLCSAVYNSMTETGSTKEGFMPSKPQDCVIELTFREGLVRFRYSGVPIAPDGFDVTLRLIPIGVSTKRKSLAELGYSPDQCDMLERIFSYSSGLILFAGTTGSGKSTSMANMIEKIATERPGKKIRTVEEPVEFRIPGAYQTPVTRVTGTSKDFTTVLRQLMRADPDIIMVGEIRDEDTAHLAIQAVRSGHLCISTIHADGAPICYDRLAGMGINRLDLASVGLVAGLIYQKLVAVLCPHCRLPAADYAAGNPDDPILKRLERVTGLEGVYFRRPGGCDACHKRGIAGRSVCAEIMRPTPDMLKAVSSGDSRELWRHWRSTIDADNPHLMTGRTAFEHAIDKMRRGLVSPHDVESEFRYLDERPFEVSA